jgi:drug/metabolite transporter (DMT)-like permease
MDPIIIGELAALATSFFWASSSTFFTLGGKRQSPQTVNRWRLVGAVILLGLFHVVILGHLIPNESLYVWLLLGLSGIIGLSVGDGFLLWAYVKVGPRISMLVMSMAPVVTTGAAWFLMDEELSFWKLIAIGITLAGVSWVVTDRKNGGGKDNKSPFKLTAFGLLLAVGGMIGQAIQLLLAKDAMTRMVSENVPLTATFIRIVWGAASMWFATIILGRTRHSFRAFKDNRFILWISLATIFGPFLGIWASFIAIDFAPIGIASTLMALPPLLIIPISHFVFKEKITVRAIVGTVIALVGVAGLFLW